MQPMGQTAGSVFQKFSRELARVPGLGSRRPQKKSDDDADGQRAEDDGNGILLGAFLPGMPDLLGTVTGKAGDAVGCLATPRIIS